MRGDPTENVPGRRIVIPRHPAEIRAREVDLDDVRRSYLRNALAALPEGAGPEPEDIAFLAAETRTSTDYVEEALDALA